MKKTSDLAYKVVKLKNKNDKLLKIIKYSLKIVETLPCECDPYNGFTCGKHEWERKLRKVIKESKEC